MPEFKVPPELEAKSLVDLEAIVKQAGVWGIKLALIGGYAARAYTSPTHYRGTKDIDFISSKADLGRLKGMLKELGYAVQETRYGLNASKKTKAGEIRLNIAIERVIDDSTGKAYALSQECFTKAEEMEITAWYEENKSLHAKALVAPIEDVLIMKLTTDSIARPRDKFDFIAILLDSFAEIDLSQFAQKCKQSGLQDLLKNRLNELLVQAKRNRLGKLWKEYTGLDFLRAQETRIKALLNQLLKSLV